MKDARPAVAAVGASVEPPFVVRSPQVAHRRDVHEVGVRRVQGDPADVAALPQSHVGPGGTAVGALVHAVAPRRALAIGALASAHPNHRRVHLVDRDRADGVGSLAFEDGEQRDPVVRRLEHAPGCRRDVELDRVGFDDSQVHDPPAHDRRADVAGAKGVQLLGGDAGWGPRVGRGLRVEIDWRGPKQDAEGEG